MSPEQVRVLPLVHEGTSPLVQEATPLEQKAVSETFALIEALLSIELYFLWFDFA